MGKWIRFLNPSELTLILFVLVSSFVLLLSDKPLHLPLDDLRAFPWKSILGLTIGGIILKKRREKTIRMQELLRTLLPFILIILVYPLVPALIHAVGRVDQDHILQETDRFIFFNHDPQRLIEPFINGPLSEWMAFCYSSYGFFLLTLVFWLFLNPDLRPLKKLIFDLTLCLTLGYLGYILFPAIGPIYTQTFSTPIELNWMESYKQVLMDQTRIDRDCFPSLHTALTLVMLGHFKLHFKKVFPYLAIVLITIPFACIYLRYHYFVDVLAGILLFGLIRMTSLKIVDATQ